MPATSSSFSPKYLHFHQGTMNYPSNICFQRKAHSPSLSEDTMSPNDSDSSTPCNRTKPLKKRKPSPEPAAPNNGTSDTSSCLRQTTLHPAPYYNYTDRSTLNDDDPLTPLTPHYRIPSFLVKLFCILNRSDLQHIIKWLPHGRSWRITDSVEFEINVIPKYFGHGSMASFMRQVNGWGFKRMAKGRNKNSYYNEFFLRGLPHLIKMAARPNSNKEGKEAKDKSDANGNAQFEPDLFAISEEFPVPERIRPNDECGATVDIIDKCIREQGAKGRVDLSRGKTLPSETECQGMGNSLSARRPSNTSNASHDSLEDDIAYACHVAKRLKTADTRNSIAMSQIQSCSTDDILSALSSAVANGGQSTGRSSFSGVSSAGSHSSFSVGTPSTVPGRASFSYGTPSTSSSNNTSSLGGSSLSQLIQSSIFPTSFHGNNQQGQTNQQQMQVPSPTQGVSLLDLLKSYQDRQQMIQQQMNQQRQVQQLMTSRQPPNSGNPLPNAAYSQLLDQLLPKTQGSDQSGHSLSKEALQELIQKAMLAGVVMGFNSKSTNS